MHCFIFLSAFALAVDAFPKPVHKQTPFRFPLSNGFPNITSNAAYAAIEKQAGGPLPNSSSKTSKLSETSAHALSAVSVNELFEVAFFTQLLENVTVSHPLSSDGKDVGDFSTANFTSWSEQCAWLRVRSEP